MKVSPFAGKPAEPSMLVNVPRLVRPITRRSLTLQCRNSGLTEHLVQGVDVWINTPRRPWEASGTSGMKVLVNGGINLSELDGWWAEA
jgi:starch phosphorylase